MKRTYSDIGFFSAHESNLRDCTLIQWMVRNNEAEDHSHVNYLVHFATIAAEPGFGSLSFSGRGFISIENPHSGGVPKDDRVSLGRGANKLAIAEKGITLNKFSLRRDLYEVCPLLIDPSFVCASR